MPNDALYRPELTHASRPLTFEVQATNELGEMEPVFIAGENPLTVYVDRQEVVTLMTLGAAPEALVIGYLRNQRLINRIEDIASVQVDWETNACAVVTHGGIRDLQSRIARRTVTTGCGQGTVFGGLMDEVESIRLPQNVRIRQETLYTLLDNVRRHETIYKQAGAVHGCALGDAQGNILMFVEDVGRHNAVDAIAGQMWLDRIDSADKIFYTTGRLTSEMVIKCAQMGIPILVSRSGLTQMGYEVARMVNLTMFGRAHGKHFLLFTGSERFQRGNT